MELLTTVVDITFPNIKIYDNHTFHFVFDNAKHFDAGDSCTISLQASADITGNGYWHVTTVVEFDTANDLGSSSTEHDSTP